LCATDEGAGGRGQGAGGRGQGAGGRGQGAGAVWCLVGQARTAPVRAAYRIGAGATPDEALSELRALSPDAIGAAEQALRRFAANRDWIV